MSTSRVPRDTRAYRAVADQAVYDATRDAFNKYFRAIAIMYPKGNAGSAAKAYIEALRERLEWYEQAERTARGRAVLS